MNEHFSLAELDDNVPSLSLDYPGVLRAWAQLCGDIDQEDDSLGASLSESIEKWNGVSDTKYLDEEFKVTRTSSPAIIRSSSGFGIGSQAPASPCMCSYPYTHHKSCFNSTPGRVLKSPFIGAHRTTSNSLQDVCVQDRDFSGSTHKTSMCSGIVPHFCPPLSYLPMEPFPLGKMDCTGVSRPMVPVSSILSMKQPPCSSYGGPTNMSRAQQAVQSSSDEQQSTQHVPVGNVVMSNTGSSCSLAATKSLPCSLKAPADIVACSRENVAHTKAKVDANLNKCSPKSNSQVQLRIQLEEMKGWKGRFRTRKQSLDRYMEKKARRLQTKKIRYELRKINADRRPRIKGRFAKKEQFEEYMKNQRAEIEC